jgi:hypothetical protein
MTSVLVPAVLVSGAVLAIMVAAAMAGGGRSAVARQWKVMASIALAVGVAAFALGLLVQQSDPSQQRLVGMLLASAVAIASAVSARRLRSGVSWTERRSSYLHAAAAVTFVLVAAGFGALLLFSPLN